MSFNWKKWLTRAGRGQQQSVARFRPGLEGLETRHAPAALMVNDFIDRTTMDSVLSLREAVLLVNNAGNSSAALGRSLTPGEQAQISGAFGSSDGIRFTPAFDPRTITLSAGELLLGKSVTILGPGASVLTVSGNRVSRVFEVAAGIAVTIGGLTVADGSRDFGGGISNAGTLTLSNANLTGNSATQGAGIYNPSGTLTVTDSTLVGNSATNGGGAIHSYNGTVSVNGSTLTGNHAGLAGGAIYSSGGSLTVSDSTLSDNSSSAGGAIYAGGTLTLSHSTLDGNHAGSGGAVENTADAIINDTTLSNNSAGYRGGAIYSDWKTLNLSHDTLTGNSAEFGGGIYNNADATVIQSLIDGNSAEYGGGIRNDHLGTLSLGDSTVSHNTAEFDGGGIANDGTLNVSATTLGDNSAGIQGGGIVHRAGTLTLSDSTLSGNSALVGGGICNEADADVRHCTLDGNSADHGGGIYSANYVFDGIVYSLATADISDSTLSGNFALIAGGGIYNQATLSLRDSTLDGNSAFSAGGGLYNADGGLSDGTVSSFAIADISGSTLIENSAFTRGGGICNDGATITVSNSRLLGNSADSGGGICNFSTVLESTAAVTDSTVAGNTASNGGGIFNSGAMAISNSFLVVNSGTNLGGGILNAGTLSVSNSTLTANTSSYGGAIFNVETLSVSNCTVSGNSAKSLGAGIANLETLTARNNIVAGNTSPNAPDISGAMTVDLGHNLIGDTSGGSGFAASDLLNVNPLLAPLGNYGGPTQTMALLPGSPAIDAGGNSNAPATDERGLARIVNGTNDIGAFESRGFTMTILGGNNQQARVNSSYTSALTVAVTSAFGEPVKGGVVTLSAPESGASATFPSGNTTSLNLIGKGAITVRANGIAGSYIITVTARGTAPVNFNLRNVDATAVSLSSSANPANLGQAVTFTALVRTSTAGSGTPTGTVTFFDGTTALGTATVDATGRARFTAAGFALAAGSHTITARYNGDANFLASTSAALTQKVLSMQEQGAALVSKIDALIAAGALSSTNGNTLKSMVNDAMTSFNAGNTSAGVTKMKSFISRVTDFGKSGLLTEAQTKDLIDAAQWIIISAEGP